MEDKSPSTGLPEELQHPWIKVAFRCQFWKMDIIFFVVKILRIETTYYSGGTGGEIFQ